MTSAAFKQALEATGYLGPHGRPAPGLVPADDPRATRMRAVFSDDRVGLNADAVFSAQNAPTSIFKDAGDAQPSEADLRHWQEAAWNVGVAPLLWIITPTDVRLYDCYESPDKTEKHPDQAPRPMDDPGAEREQLTSKHLELIRDFVEGRSLIPERHGQGRLFRFRFNAIPVDLISSIYQQFARTSAADEARSQGLHYSKRCALPTLRQLS